MAKSKAAQEANRRYESKAYDRILVLFPKGTKAMIQATGSTVNGFIKMAVKEKLQALQPETQPEPQQSKEEKP